ncbi:hypothetical protein BBJ28_00010502 [Nothophytophthora sp. Chile5]|nr:hypothetical protein BBJ28_00010502 [Nothophytophthora sp. Chile5]
MALPSGSQRVALSANRNKNWRANYLRALNIFTPDVRTSSRGLYPTNTDAAASSSRRTQQQRSGRADGATATTTASNSSSRRRPMTTSERSGNGSNSSDGRGRVTTSASVSTSSARQSSRTSSSRSRSRQRGSSPSEDKGASSYVFGLRSNLFRARRPTPRSEFMVVDRVSAPIEIPTGSCAASPMAISHKLADGRDSDSHRRRDRSIHSGSTSDFLSSTDKQPIVQLLSWEEPAVMLGTGGWPLESDKRNGNSGLGVGFAMGMGRNDRGRSTQPFLSRGGIAEECEETEDEDVDVDARERPDDADDDIFMMEFEGSEGATNDDSNNLFRASKERRRRDRHKVSERLRPGDLDEDEDGGGGGNQALSESFVPPHQMVERDCFSLGLRDEFKRKPGVRI